MREGSRKLIYNQILKLAALEGVRRKADEFDTLHFHIDFLHAPLVHDFMPCLALVVVATRSGSSGGPGGTSSRRASTWSRRSAPRP
jgi:hypothetical protein